MEETNNMAAQPEAESRKQPIGENEIAEAFTTLTKYINERSHLNRRIVNAEEWWKNNHWERFDSDSSNENDPKPVSAWLFNSVINKHADFQDNYPCPAILPRERSDEPIAKTLSEVVPAILEQNGFDRTYSACSWDKVKTGTGVYGVFWNPEKENGLGDIEIKEIDLMNIYWEPCIDDIQRSRNLFTLELVDRDILEEQYPQLVGQIGEVMFKPQYIYESNLDTSNKAQVIDWYYKKRVVSEVSGIRSVR